MTTSTCDTEGEVTSRRPVDISYEELEEALGDFVGEVEQTPPAYSALKVKGKRAYELAREGKEVELEPRMITVHSLELLDWDPPEAVVDIQCSSGTYVRSLASVLGETLGSGATRIGLSRTKNGRFSLRDAVSHSCSRSSWGLAHNCSGRDTNRRNWSWTPNSGSTWLGKRTDGESY